MAVIDFNSEDAPATTGFDPIPSGDYEAVVTESDYKPTKAGTGHYLKLTFEIIDGEFKGRKLWANFNLDNPNDEAVGIARSQLRQLCEAVNVKHVKDTMQLHNLPVIVRVVKKLDKTRGEEVNEIKKYLSMNGETNSTTTSKPAPNKPKDTAQPGTTAPWKQQKQSA